MSSMMDRLHEIREAHAKELEGMPSSAYNKPFPEKCSHCGGPLPVADAANPTPGFRIVGISWGENRKDTKAKVESPPCPNCGKTTIFEY